MADDLLLDIDVDCFSFEPDASSSSSSGATGKSYAADDDFSSLLNLHQPSAAVKANISDAEQPVRRRKKTREERFGSMRCDGVKSSGRTVRGRGASESFLDTPLERAPDLATTTATDRAVDPRVGQFGTGVVTMFNEDRGFGFIAPDDGGDELYVKQSRICGKVRRLRMDERCEFYVETGTEGRLQAVRVTGGGDPHMSDKSLTQNFSVSTRVKSYRLNYLCAAHEESQRCELLMDTVAAYSWTDSVSADKQSLILMHLNSRGSQAVVSDTCASVGGNVVNMAAHFKHVNAVEMDRLRFRMLQHNIKALRVQNVSCSQGDFTQMDGMLSNVVFMDPPWGGPDYKDREHLQLFMSGMPMHRVCARAFKKWTGCETVALKLPINFDLESFRRDFGAMRQKIARKAQGIQADDAQIAVFRFAKMVMLVVSLMDGDAFAAGVDKIRSNPDIGVECSVLDWPARSRSASPRKSKSRKKSRRSKKAKKSKRSKKHRSSSSDDDDAPQLPESSRKKRHKTDHEDRAESNTSQS